jgi:hypothetical protein
MFQEIRYGNLAECKRRTNRGAGRRTPLTRKTQLYAKTIA